METPLEPVERRLSGLKTPEAAMREAETLSPRRAGAGFADNARWPLWASQATLHLPAHDEED